MKRSLIISLIIIIICVVNISYANDILDDPSLLYKLPTNDEILNQKVTIQRKFSDISQLTEHLNNLDGIKTIIKNRSGEIPTPVTACIDGGTVRDLLNQTSTKLGYIWSLNGDKVIFTAIYPIKESSLIKPYSFSSSIGLAKSESIVYLKMLWNLNPSDKTLRNALNRWCNKAGWQLVWNVKADYLISNSWDITGKFESAINQVLKASQQTETPLLAKMHDSNRVLEIYSPIKTD